MRLASLVGSLVGSLAVVVVAELQWHVGTISKTSDVKIADVPGMSNPTVNASKNGLIGVVLLIWLFITQYYGHQLRKLLKGGGGAAAEKKVRGFECDHPSLSLLRNSNNNAALNVDFAIPNGLIVLPLNGSCLQVPLLRY